MMQQGGGGVLPFAIKGDGVAYASVPAFYLNTATAPIVTFYWDGGNVDSIGHKTNYPTKSVFSSQRTNFVYTNNGGRTTIERLFYGGDTYWNIQPNTLYTRQQSYKNFNTGTTMICNNQYCVCRIQIGTIYDLIPWIENGEVGFYDTINSVFYPNVAGSGQFTVIMHSPF